jgi:hypothetical protein
MDAIFGPMTLVAALKDLQLRLKRWGARPNSTSSQGPKLSIPISKCKKLAAINPS